jgi:type I restriction enzyme, S subunit
MASRGDISKNTIQPLMYKEWPLVPFEDILGKIGSYVKLKSKDYFETGNYPVIDQGERMIAGYVNDSKLLYKGELPIVIFGDHTRSIKYINYDFAVGADGTKILKPLDIFDTKFFYYYLRSLKIPSLGYSRHYSILRELDFPLTPFSEQKQISQKLDSIFQHFDKLSNKLDRIPELINSFREAVLTQAITGKLTEKWRANKSIDIKPILIKLEAQRLKQPKNANRRNELIDIFLYEEIGAHFPIPGQWAFVALDKICESFQYGSSQKSSSDGEVVVLRMGNLQNGKIDWSDLKYSSDEDEIRKYLLSKGDVLFNRTNSPELVGKTAIYNGEKAAIFAGYLIRINYFPILSGDYLNLCLNTRYAKSWCNLMKSDGVNQSNINAQKLAKFELPFCSLEEQLEIVRCVGELFSVIDKIENAYKLLRNNASALPEAVLAKAFRGELVKQHSNGNLTAELASERDRLKMVSDETRKMVSRKIKERSIALNDKSEKANNKVSMKVLDIIKEKFGYHLFTYDDLNNILQHNSKEKYVVTKNELFALLRNNKFNKKEPRLATEIDKVSGVIKYKLID